MIQGKFQALASGMDERFRRRWAATEALALGWGGISAVAQATGLARNTIAAGIADLEQSPTVDPSSARLRRRGAGRKSLVEIDPGLLDALDTLVDPATRGHPQSPLRWTCKSTRLLAATLTRQGHPISPRAVAGLLIDLGYSLQANKKTREGASHPDRDAQFEHIGRQVERWQRQGQPVISVDTKKKELIGDFKTRGREWQPVGQPEPVRVHDFVDPALGKAIPYGVYDVTNDQGWVSVGIDHDTAEFAAATITRWWDRLGAARFPKARRLLITADGGGSNSHRSRLWKVALQGAANRLGMPVSVPLPAGDEQVEQDRAPAVLPDHQQLARAAAGESPGDRQPDRRYQDEVGDGSPCGTRYEHLPDEKESHRRGTGSSPYQSRRVPRRVELYHLAQSIILAQIIRARILSLSQFVR